MPLQQSFATCKPLQFLLEANIAQFCNSSKGSGDKTAALGRLCAAHSDAPGVCACARARART